MRKNFLILMLLSLLPLAGWAAEPVDLAGYSIKFGETDATSARYTGGDLAPAISLVKESSPTLTTGFNVVWTKGGEVVTEVKTKGTYVVTIESDLDNTVGTLTTPTKTFYVLIAENDWSTSGAVLATAQDYRATGYDLLSTTPVPNFGNVYYKVTDNSTVPAADAEGWSTDVPHATKVGTHYVYAKVDADPAGNYKAIAPAAVGAGSVTINGTALEAGADKDYVAPTAPAATLSFDNTDQPLATAGQVKSANCTAIMYSLDNENWQNTVPTGKNATNYTVYWKAVGKEGYKDATGNFSVTINAGTPVITAAAAASGTLTYTGVGQPLLSNGGNATLGATPTFTLKYSTTKPANAEAWTTIDTDGSTYTAYGNVKGTKAGFYLVTTQVADGGNYTGAVAKTTEVEIKKATLTVTTENKSKVYSGVDTDDPTFTVTYSNWQNHETETVLTTAPTVSCTHTQNVGVYDITAAGGVAGNYEFSYQNTGKFSITQKELNDDDFTFTLKAASQSQVYTGEPLTVEFDKAKFGTTDLVSPTDYNFVPTNNTNVGTATVIISGQGNFKGSVTRTFTITAAPIYIKPDANSKNYGVADPTPLTTYKLVDNNGDEVAGATLNGTVNFTRTAGNSVGTYTISVESYTPGATTDNYAPTALNTYTAAFTINPVATTLKLKFKDSAVNTKVYGDDTPAWTIDDLEPVATDPGFIGTDTWETVKPTLSTPTFTIASELVAGNSTNQATVTGLYSVNYPTVTVEPMNFTITAREIAITVKAQTIAYGADLAQDAEHADDNEWAIDDTHSHGSDWNGNREDALSVLNVTLSTVGNKDTYLASGTAHTSVITATINNDNYNLTTITKGNLTVTPSDDVILTRSGEGSNANIITAYAGKNTGTVKIKGGVLKANYWYTLVLPFKVKVRDISTAFGYAVVDVPNSVNPNKEIVSFKLKVDNEYIDPNTLILIKIDQDRNLNDNPAQFTLSTATPIVNAPENVVSDAAGNKYYVTYDFKSLDPTENANCWYLYEDPSYDYSYNVFYCAGDRSSAWNVASMSGYFDAAAGNGARVYVQEADGTITAISAAEIDVKAQNIEGWYTINGVKLNAAPTQKGIYIQNGKKVIVK